MSDNRAEILGGLAIGATFVVEFFSSYDLFIGIQFDLEELLGIIAITTFLLGFSSVRLQSRLEDARTSIARRIESILAQNANQDLLPFPTSFIQYDQKQTNKFWDIVTFSTVVLTWIAFFISCLFIFLHQKVSATSSTQFYLLQLIHLIIVIMGTCGPFLAEKTFGDYTKRQPFYLYDLLQKALWEFLEEREDTRRKEDLGKEVLASVKNLEESIPEWCWLELIRGSLDDPMKNKPQLQRLHTMAAKNKDNDDFSLIAFVWSAYLLQPADDYRSVKQDDLKQIMEFSKSRKAFKPFYPDAYAEMALRQAVESREDVPNTGVEWAQEIAKHQIEMWKSDKSD